MRTADIVVIGGGIVGAAAAYEAATLGATTVVVDRRDPGRATDAGAGILSPETTANPDDAWYAFALAAADHYRRLVPALEEITGLDTGYAQCGALCLALHPNELPWFHERLALASRRGTSVAEVTPDDAVRRFPALGRVTAAMHSPQAARVDGRLMGQALTAAAERSRASVLRSSVVGVVTKADRVVEVTTQDGPIACGAVVVAGGAWSAELEDVLGVALPVTPMKGQIVHLQVVGPDAGDTERWPIAQPIANYYLVPWAGGRVVCGGTLEADAGFDTRVTASGTNQLLREALRMAPRLRDASLLEVRVGLRPTSVDDLPIVGPLRTASNVFVATGHGTEGLLLGPYSSRCVVRQALDDSRVEPLVAPFSPGRFAP